MFGKSDTKRCDQALELTRPVERHSHFHQEVLPVEPTQVLMRRIPDLSQHLATRRAGLGTTLREEIVVVLGPEVVLLLLEELHCEPCDDSCSSTNLLTFNGFSEVTATLTVKDLLVQSVRGGLDPTEGLRVEDDHLTTHGD